MVHVHATSMYAVPVSMLHLYILVSKAVGGVIVKVISAFFSFCFHLPTTAPCLEVW